MADPTSFTLRFKHGRATILLLATPLTSFSNIISELLDVLRERYPKGLPRQPTSAAVSSSSLTIAIPDNILDVTLGVAADAYDAEKGWEELDIGAAGMTESPRSLGLKEGAAIAFFVQGEKGFWVDVPDLSELYPEDE